MSGRNIQDIRGRGAQVYSVLLGINTSEMSLEASSQRLSVRSKKKKQFLDSQAQKEERQEFALFWSYLKKLKVEQQTSE